MNEVLDRPVIHLGEVVGVAQSLVGALVEMGVDAIHRELPIPAPNSVLPVKVLRMGPRLIAAQQIRGELRDRNAIAHVHYATSAVFFLGRHPLVLHCHGTDVRDPALWQRRVLDRIFPAAELVVASTPDLLQWLPSSARYLPNPVDTFHFASTTSVTAAERDVFIFSALSDVKGAPEILKVVRELRRIRPNLRITAVRNGPYAGEFEAAGVTMVGYQPQSELPMLINSHSVVIGQRRLKALGTAELQAMACGRPVALPVGSYWADKESPPVLSEEDPQLAAESIVELLDNPSMASKAGESARNWVVDNHGLNFVAEKLLGWYKELA